jgi:hypothetical protein
MRPGNHGSALYDEQMLVPLILYDPTRRHPVRRVAAQVRWWTLVRSATCWASRDGPARPIAHPADDRRADRVAWLDIPRYDCSDPARSLRTGRFG